MVVISKLKLKFVLSRDLKAQAGYWFQQPSKNKKRIKTGTDILKKSLDTNAAGARKYELGWRTRAYSITNACIQK